jgi:hypothetical protein
MPPSELSLVEALPQAPARRRSAEAAKRETIVLVSHVGVVL